MKMISEAITAGSLQALSEECARGETRQQDRHAARALVELGGHHHHPNRKQRRAIEAEERRSAKRKAVIK